MFRSVTPRLFRQAALEDLKKVNNSRSMAAVPKRGPRPKQSILEVLRRIQPRGYVAFGFPLATFALAAWQVKRSIWKGNLIEELESRVHRPPVPLPETLEEMKKKEYCAVKVRGEFDHSREILLGPRSLLNSKKPSSTLLSDGSNAGFFVLTPFKLSDRDYSIWVNRGWVPVGQRDPKTRQGGQIEGEIEFTGLVRVTEKRPQFVHSNEPDHGIWIYRDLEQMCSFSGEDICPISIDADADSSLPDGPIGGQTLINTKNTHYNYAITWFSLSLLSGVIWYQSFVATVARIR